MKGNMATQEFQEFMNGIGSMYKAGADEMEGVEGGVKRDLSAMRAMG